MASTPVGHPQNNGMGTVSSHYRLPSGRTSILGVPSLHDTPDMPDIELSLIATDLPLIRISTSSVNVPTAMGCPVMVLSSVPKALPPGLFLADMLSSAAAVAPLAESPKRYVR